VYTIKPVLRFDPAKSERNCVTRGFGFECETAEEFDWATSWIVEDRRLDCGERRYIALGFISGRLHVMVYTERVDAVQLISLRKANRRERIRYEAETKAHASDGREPRVDA
jgi:uncharacterized DUF497 family protein